MVKKDNKGMTLVELLIAITMLALVSTPFINSFLVSVRSNYKARNVLRATTVAQNLMEGLEAFSLEDICEQIRQDAANTKLYLPHGYEAHCELPNAQGETSDVQDGKFISTSSNQYCFAIGGIEEDGILYDAKVLVDASGYRYTGNEEDEKWTYNEAYTLDISTMNENKDVVFSLPQSADEGIEGFKGVAEANYKEGFGALKRVFHVKVEELGNDSTKVSIAVTYGEGANKKNGPQLEKTVKELDHIYLMYYPNYSGAPSGSLDRFEMEITTDRVVNFCLIKQKYETPMAENTLLYSPSLQVTHTANYAAAHEAGVVLKTNIGKNLYDAAGTVRKEALQCSYFLNGREEDADKMLGFVEGAPQSLLGESKKVTPMYHATVQIYPSGTYDASNPTTFENTEVLVQLDNKK